MGANPGGMGGCIPPIYFVEVKNSPYEPISSPQYRKVINFAKSSPPQYLKMANFAKSPPDAQHRFALLSIKRDFGNFFSNIPVVTEKIDLAKFVRIFSIIYPVSQLFS